MAITYHIDAPRGLVLTTASGVLTDEELLDHKRRLVEDPHFTPGMKELSDVRGVDKLNVTPEGIGQMVALDKLHAPRLGDYRLAILASEDFVFGTARMYQMLTEDSLEGVRVFRDRAEAEEWLGV